MLQNLIDMSNVGVSEGSVDSKKTDRETIRVARGADIEAVRRLVNQAFDVERFLKRGGGDRL